MVLLILAVQPFEAVTVIVQVPIEFMLVVATLLPLDHKQLEYPGFALKVIELPGQNEDVPEIAGEGGNSNEVLILTVPVQPLALVTFTEKAPAVFTEIV